ncbi:MAG: class I fructose-bisphosphate aldolase [Elusimicrobia bacterium]|nr:class I fructose-bisphosphate aldolase [Elusimicrobiota bacterium]
MTNKVKTILANYQSDNPGTVANIARILNHGKLAGTGKVVILPVDQGFEHGPTRSFGPNAPGYDPRYHIELAIEAGLNAYAAPLGQIEAASREFPGEIPLILKANNNELLGKSNDPIPAVTATVKDALRLGCAAVGFTIYPGSANAKQMYEEARRLIDEAKTAGLAAVLWSYPRGSALSKEGETAVDVAAYAAHIACQLGAHLVKVKPPTAHMEKEEAKKVFEKYKIKTETLADRVRHVVESAFNGKRLVIFSGGPAKGKDEILTEIRGIREGGGFGSIIGRNAFQRPKKEALALLDEIIGIYRG